MSNYVFLMDPLESVIMEKDTSFMLMLGAHRRGHRVFYLPTGGLSLRNGRLQFRATQVQPQQISERPFVVLKEATLADDDVDAVFIRTDPPFNETYLMQTWLLDQVADRIPMINRPAGIRSVNEKVWVARFADLVPPTLVSRSRDDLQHFVREQQDVIAKPTDAFGGHAVFRLQQGGHNVNVTLETLTDRFRKEIILQRFVPESATGDKRILLLNGEPLGAVLRVHAEDDHRNNFFSGGKPVAAAITEREQAMIRVLQPELRRLGLYFVGIDVIGDYLIEVNVTSPTCLQEMNRLYQEQLEDTVMEFVDALVERSHVKQKMDI